MSQIALISNSFSEYILSNLSDQEKVIFARLGFLRSNFENKEKCISLTELGEELGYSRKDKTLRAFENMKIQSSLWTKTQFPRDGEWAGGRERDEIYLTIKCALRFAMQSNAPKASIILLNVEYLLRNKT